MDQKTQDILAEILSGARIEIVWALIVTGVIFYFLIFIKDFINNVMFYFQFKGNRHVSLGTLVEVNNFVGKIKDFGLKHIIIEGERGYYRLPMKTWQRQDWIFLRTERQEENRIAGQRLGLRSSDDIKVDRNSQVYKDFIDRKRKGLKEDHDS